MEITRENYEAILLDYLEGRLPEDNRREAESFLAQNPDIAADFALLSDCLDKNGNTVSLPEPEENPFPDKDLLYRIARDPIKCTPETKKTVFHRIPFPSVHTGKIRRFIPYAAAIAACILLFLVFLPRPDRIIKTDTLASIPGSGSEINPAITDSTPKQVPYMVTEETAVGETPTKPLQKMPEKKDIPQNPSPESQLTDPGIPDNPESPKPAEPHFSDSLPKLTPGNLRRIMSPMSRPKAYYAQIAGHLELLPRTDPMIILQETHSEQVAEPSGTRKDSKARQFFASLFKSYTEPIREQIEENVENLRSAFQWNDYTTTTDTVYQAFWEEESDF